MRVISVNGGNISCPHLLFPAVFRNRDNSRRKPIAGEYRENGLISMFLRLLVLARSACEPVFRRMVATRFAPHLLKWFVWADCGKADRAKPRVPSRIFGMIVFGAYLRTTLITLERHDSEHRASQRNPRELMVAAHGLRGA
ncbi:hypothetical protein [Bifidobacterium myosotis]|uniref:Uncharacterized protein n=1 Tax=Bifidobacterium myosotis TaxID=1630166 RepID=A0A5M9ZG83_9BIFI|nr:hypothetical protein [Bifidobacterium myosotis]KAA8825816.1 hypothetical protein EMO91_11720 [Bifidobacterium myosotis]